MCGACRESAPSAGVAGDVVVEAGVRDVAPGLPGVAVAVAAGVAPGVSEGGVEGVDGDALIPERSMAPSGTPSSSTPSASLYQWMVFEIPPCPFWNCASSCTEAA